MKIRSIVMCACAIGASTGFASADVLWDNGMMDGLNGLSHLSGPGQRRSVLDDFTVGATGWAVEEFHLKFAWSDGSVNSGTGIELAIYGDNGGAPDFNNLIATLNTHNYQETLDPDTPEFFGLQVVDVSVTTDEFALSEGTYWLDMHVLGPVNGMQPTNRSGSGNAWLDYEDFGGRFPTEDIFGAGYDTVFKIGGNAAPAPGVAGLLAAAGIVGRRRRRRAA